MYINLSLRIKSHNDDSIRKYTAFLQTGVLQQLIGTGASLELLEAQP